MSRTPVAAAALALLGACGVDAASSSPTWIDDVRPIVYANCVRCHGYPQISETPLTWRLDAYDITPRPEGGDPIDGAAAVGATGRLPEPFTGEATPMPPRFGMPDGLAEVLIEWSSLGDSETGELPPRGERSDNLRPDMTLLEDVELGGTRGVARYEIEDPDDDPVTGVLFAQGDGDPIPLQIDLYAGRGSLAFRIELLAPGEYDLFAELDDGVEVTTVDLGPVEIP